MTFFEALVIAVMIHHVEGWHVERLSMAEFPGTYRVHAVYGAGEAWYSISEYRPEQVRHDLDELAKKVKEGQQS